jgi:outer membrane protein
MVSKQTSLPAIGLILILTFSSGFSPLPGATRREGRQINEVTPGALSRLTRAPVLSETLALSLRECIALALDRNLDLIVEGFNPRIRTTEVLNEEAEFDPSVIGGFRYIGGREQLAGSPDRYPPNRGLRQEGVSPLAGIEQRLGLGTRLALQFSYDRLDNNDQSLTTRFIDPSSDLRTTLSLTQPLMRNLGSDVNRARIRIAQTSQEISESVLRDRIIRVVSRVQELYWDLVFRIQELEVRRLSLKLAQDLLEQTRVQVAVGTQPQISILEAEAGVAAREEAVIVAENDVRTVEDRLKELLNLFDDQQHRDASIVPTDSPQFMIEEINLNKALEEAFEHRPDYRQARLEIESRSINERFTRNQLLPALDLQGRVGINGLDQNAGEAFSNYTSGDFVHYQVGLAFRYPLGNQAARSRFTRARLEVEQAKTVLERTEQRILVEVREAVRNVETSIKRVSVTRGARELAQKKLEAEEKKLAVGLSSVREILRFQDDLSREQSREIRALTDYNISLANLERAKGTTLERMNIVVDER